VSSIITVVEEEIHRWAVISVMISEIITFMEAENQSVVAK
jgi:hypothetical protein